MLPGFCAAEPRNDPRRKLERLHNDDINGRVLQSILLFYALSCSYLPIRSCSAVCQIAIPGVIRIQTRLLYNQLIYYHAVFQNRLTGIDIALPTDDFMVYCTGTSDGDNGSGLATLGGAGGGDRCCCCCDRIGAIVCLNKIRLHVSN